MFNSKLSQAFKGIFTALLLVSIFLFFLYQGGHKDLIILITMMLALVVSTFGFIPHPDSQSTKEVYFSYLSGYLSHLIIIIVIFLVGVWELSQQASIGTWFYVLILTTALSRPVLYLLVKSFNKK